MNNAIRSTLARIRRQSDAENLDPIIDQALENYPEATIESTATLRTYVNNFINSELGKQRVPPPRPTRTSKFTQILTDTSLRVGSTDSFKTKQDTGKSSFTKPAISRIQRHIIQKWNFIVSWHIDATQNNRQ